MSQCLNETLYLNQCNMVFNNYNAFDVSENINFVIKSYFQIWCTFSLSEYLNY
jgi:hypothetical protein